MPGAKTLDYFENEYFTGVKSFITSAPGRQCYLTFLFVADEEANKATAFLPGKPLQRALVLAGSGAFLSGTPLFIADS